MTATEARSAQHEAVQAKQPDAQPTRPKEEEEEQQQQQQEQQQPELLCTICGLKSCWR